jgi:hypothetical protein
MLTTARSIWPSKAGTCCVYTATETICGRRILPSSYPQLASASPRNTADVGNRERGSIAGPCGIQRPASGARRLPERLPGAPGWRVQEPAMPSEDFAFMLQAQAGCYAFIGNGDGQHRESGHGEGPCMLHNPSYDFNDSLISVGTAYWVGLVEEWLGADLPDGSGFRPR